MARTSTAELEARIQELEQQLSRLTGRSPQPREIPLEERADYIEHGSDRHAAWLSLRKATAEDELKYEGWALQDVTAFGVTADKDMLRAILRQKVGELQAPPAPQTVNPHAPNYAPPMFRPEGVP